MHIRHHRVICSITGNPAVLNGSEFVLNLDFKLEDVKSEVNVRDSKDIGFAYNIQCVIHKWSLGKTNGVYSFPLNNDTDFTG